MGNRKSPPPLPGNTKMLNEMGNTTHGHKSPFLNPLTPTLSRRERGNIRSRFVIMASIATNDRDPLVRDRPAGRRPHDPESSRAPQRPRRGVVGALLARLAAIEKILRSACSSLRVPVKRFERRRY